MNKEKFFTLLVVAAAFCFLGFIWYHEKELRSKAWHELDDCARVVSNAVWNYEDKLPLEYLALTSRKNNFNKIVITMREGDTFIELDNQITNPLDKFLINLDFTYHLSLTKEIEYNGIKIGMIKAEWYPLAFYTNLSVFVFIILLLIISWFYLRLKDAAGNLEQRVADRTAALIKTNDKLENEIKKGELIEKELIESNKRSEGLNKLKSSLLTNMSHEVRTPMNGILGLAEILSEKLTNKEYAAMANKIYKSGVRLMNTLGSILDLSELESNTIQLKVTGYNISENIEKLLKQYKNIANDKNLYLNLEIKDPLVIPFVDERICNHIILNLVDNAVKYTSVGGITVTVDSEEVGEKLWAVIKVKDTGIGIAEQNKEIIFEEFRQLSEGISRGYEGAGLGLSLAKKMLVLINGVIELESEINKGTVFTIKLPAYKNKDNNYKIIVKNETNEMIENNLKIGQSAENSLPVAMLVEDNAINGEVTALFLNNICKLEIAETGLKAIEMAKHNSFSFILMDINLGHGIDGVKTANEIRKINGYEETPICALTGYAMSADKEIFLARGFTDYLAKPFEKEELIQFVKKILNQIK